MRKQMCYSISSLSCVLSRLENKYSWKIITSRMVRRERTRSRERDRISPKKSGWEEESSRKSRISQSPNRENALSHHLESDLSDAKTFWISCHFPFNPGRECAPLYEFQLPGGHKTMAQLKWLRASQIYWNTHWLTVVANWHCLLQIDVTCKLSEMTPMWASKFALLLYDFCDDLVWFHNGVSNWASILYSY